MKIKMAADIGGSGTRIGVGDTIIETPSNYKILANDTFIVQDTKPEELIDLNIILGNGKAITRRIVIGKSKNLYKSNIQQIYNDSTKSESEETLVALSVGIHEYMYQTLILINPDSKKEVKNLTVSNIVVALPPIEVNSQKGLDFKAKLSQSVITLNYPLLNKTVTINIKDVGIIAEGIAALASLGEAKTQEIAEMRTLIIDSGRRSTELELLYEYDIINGAMRTISMSGISLENALMQELFNSGIEATEDELLEIVQTGYFHKKRCCSKELNKVRRDFCEALKLEVRKFCGAFTYNYNNIDAIVAFGRLYKDPTSKEVTPFIDLLKESFEGKDITIVATSDCNVKGILEVMNEDEQ